MIVRSLRNPRVRRARPALETLEDRTAPAAHIVGDPTMTAFAKIQDAIAAASPGATINLDAGTYVENVVVNKSLTLHGAGQGASIIEPAQSKPGTAVGGSQPDATNTVILVGANNVTITNLTVEGDNPSLTSGVVLGGADIDARNGVSPDQVASYTGLKVDHVTVRDVFLRGIQSTSAASAVFGGTFTFTNDTVSNVQGDPTDGIGIFNFGGSGNIQSDAVSEAANGIAANFSSGTGILDNTVTNCAQGIHTDNVGVGGSFAFPGQFGGETLDSIFGNTIGDGMGTASSGIFVYKPGFGVTVQQNTVTGVQTALALYGGVNNPSIAFENNTLDGQGQTSSNGLLLTTDQLDGTTGGAHATAFRNTIRNFTVGVQLFQLDATATLTATLHGNIFRGNVTAVGDGNDGTASSPVDASYNFWDSTSGPTIPNDPGGVGQSIVDGSDGSLGVVHFGPFLTTPFLTTSFLVSVAPSNMPTFGQQTPVTVTAEFPPGVFPPFTAAGGTVDSSYTGTVILEGGGVLSGPATLTFAPSDQGTRTFTVIVAAAGGGFFSVVDSLSNASVFGSAAVTVSKAGTATSLTASTPSAVAGQPVAFTALVSAPGSAIGPSGTIDFVNDGTQLLGSAPLGNGTATFTTTALPPGQYHVAAVYLGNADFLGSSSMNSFNATAAVTVRPAGLGIFAVGAAEGSDPDINVFDSATGQFKFTIPAFGLGFRGGVRVAVADVFGDGVPVIIAGAGPAANGSPVVELFNGLTGQGLGGYLAFGANFHGGVYVTAGDFFGDGQIEIAAGVGEASNSFPLVNLRLGRTLADLGTVPVYDLSLRGMAVRVAAGDALGLGRDQLIVAPGPNAQGSSEVRVFDLVGFRQVLAFPAYEPGYGGGVYVAAGPLNNAVTAQIVTGPGAGHASQVNVVDVLHASERTLPAYPGYFGGVRVGVLSRTAAGGSGIVTAPGDNSDPLVAVFDGATLGELLAFGAFQPASAFMHGAFVAGS